MKNENLSQVFIQKYDALSDTFVIVENEKSEQKEDNLKQRRFEPFSLFNFRNKNKTTLVETSNSSQSEEIQITPNETVLLSKKAYNKLKVLNMLYQNIASTDLANANTYSTLIDQNNILISTMLSIYHLLSGASSIPDQDQNPPPLTGSICIDRKTIEKYLQEIIEIILSLQRNINVNNIDRQLAIISTTLLSQKSQIASMHEKC